MISFPEYACPYARKLAAASKRFRLQVDASPEANLSDDSDKYSSDPFGELANAAHCHGLRQRFEDRVLVMTSDRCFMNCRHCTRRGILGKSEIVETQAQLDKCVEYVASHPKVRDVLLSGGDILTLPDEKVLAFVDAFARLDQIDIVRVCTRAVCVNPERITSRLARRLGESGKVWVNTQFNSADEVTAEAVEATLRLRKEAINVSCQTVLLKGVNDSTAEMLELFRALTKAGIRPYYVFMCDPIAGIERFRVDIETAKRIERECAQSIGGLAMPRFVTDLPGAKRKLPVCEL